MDALRFVLTLAMFLIFFGIPFALIVGILWRIFKKLK